MKVIIIGGGACGASCATRLRRLDENCEITIFERTNEISIANCGLPYYCSNIINDRDKILVSSTNDFKLIIPGKNIYEIVKMMDSEGSIKVYVHSNNIMVDLGDTIIINRLIDGQFINYRQIVPKDFSTVVTINKEQLEDAIDRASVLSKMDKNNLVKFDIKEKNLMLTSNSEIGNTKENITVGVKGNDLTISFNSKYFTDCLRVIDNPYVKINFNSPILPCTITPTEGNDFIFLILPVKAR